MTHVSRLLVQQLVVAVVRSDPEPDKVRVRLDGERAMMKTNPSGPEFADLLEVQ
jgi:hypothetical protein